MIHFYLNNSHFTESVMKPNLNSAIRIKHQSINQSSVLCNHIAEILLKLALNTNQLINQMFCATI
jgi:hypothetical protein